MTQDKVTNAHALKDTEERTAKVKLEKILLFVNKIMSSRFQYSLIVDDGEAKSNIVLRNQADIIYLFR